MVDLAVPRDIEPEVGAPVRRLPLHRRRPVGAGADAPARSARPRSQQAEAIIDAGVQSFVHWLDQRAAVPLIQALHRAGRRLARDRDRARAQAAGPRRGRRRRAGSAVARPDAEDAARHAGRAACGRWRRSARSWRRPSRACSCARAARDPADDSRVSGAATRRRRRRPRGALRAAPLAAFTLAHRMKDSLRQQFERLALRLAELDATLADPAVAGDMKRYRELSREQAEVRGAGRALPPLRAARARPGRRARDAGRPRDGRDGARGDRRGRAPTSSACTPSCRPRCCRATRTTSATPSSRSAPAPAATSRRCSPATWRACTCATASARAGAPR